MKFRCMCQDSDGVVCNCPMTLKQKQQDGMCSFCAEEVWHEVTSKSPYLWSHKDNPLNKGVVKCL